MAQLPSEISPNSQHSKVTISSIHSASFSPLVQQHLFISHPQLSPANSNAQILILSQTSIFHKTYVNVFRVKNAVIPMPVTFVILAPIPPMILVTPPILALYLASPVLHPVYVTGSICMDRLRVIGNTTPIQILSSDVIMETLV